MPTIVRAGRDARVEPARSLTRAGRDGGDVRAVAAVRVGVGWTFKVRGRDDSLEDVAERARADDETVLVVHVHDDVLDGLARVGVRTL
jgi:hypothetical protein